VTLQKCISTCPCKVSPTVWCRNMDNAEIRRAKNQVLPAPHSWDTMILLHLECRSCRSNTRRDHCHTRSETSTGVVETCSAASGYRPCQCSASSVHRRTIWTSGRRRTYVEATTWPSHKHVGPPRQWSSTCHRQQVRCRMDCCRHRTRCMAIAIRPTAGQAVQ